MKKISSAHLLLVVLVALQLAVSLIVGLLVGRFGISLPVVFSLLISQLTLILPFAVYCIITRSNPLKLIRFKKIGGGTVAMALLVILFSYPVIIVLNMISMMFVDNAMMDIMPSAVSMGLPLAVLFMAVIPSIVEETVFRGTIYNTYSRRKPLAGIFLSALIFGLMHMNFNQMPYAFYMGIVMAFMLEASDSIVTTMIMHFTLNGFSTVISYLSMNVLNNLADNGLTSELTGSYSQVYMEMLGPLLAVAVVALVIVAVLIYVTFVINHRNPKLKFSAPHEDTAYVAGLGGKMKKNRMVDIFLAIFVIYALIQCILSAVA